jgi:HSP20 family protein
MLRFTDPFEEMDKMMSTFGGRWRGGVMPMDAYEKDGIYTLRFDLPGVDPDGVDLTVEGSLLTVTVERTVEDTEGATWLLRERPAGTHRREVRLGERLDTSRVTASYESGVLTVTIPMREEAKPHKVAVAAGDRREITAGE